MNKRTTCASWSVLLYAAMLARGQVSVVTLSTLQGPENESVVAADPNDANVGVALWMRENLEYATTRDGWSSIYRASVPSTGRCDPSVVFDTYSTGNPFWVCYFGRQMWNYRICIGRTSTDEQGRIVLDPCDVCEVASGDKPWLACGPRPQQQGNSNLYITSSVVGTNDVKVVRSLGEDPNSACGRQWTEVKDLGLKGTGAFPVISPNQAKTLYIAYWVDNPSAPDGNNPDQRMCIVKSCNAHHAQ